MTAGSLIAEVEARLEVVEGAVAAYEHARSEVIRTDTPNPEVDALRQDLDDAVRDIVTDWDCIGRPDELRERMEALPGFDRWRIEAFVDPDTVAVFDALETWVSDAVVTQVPTGTVEPPPDEPPPEWDPEPPPEPDVVPLPQALTDAQVGEAFGEVIRGRFLYCRALGGWLRWDGARWKRDTTEAVFELAREYLLAMGAELLRSGADSAQVRQAAAYRSKARIDAVVTIARRLDGIAAEVDEFDRNPDLLCCTNGVVDLRTGVLAPHDPGLRLTKTTGVAFDADARHVDVDRVLEAVDADVRDWLQVVFGYAATGHVSEDLLLVLDGTGSNAKTTLLEAIKGGLGEYARSAPQRLLMKSGNDEHPTLIAELFGRRLVTVEETAEGGSLRVEQMKALTGGSSITARFIGKDYFEFTPTHQLVVATNHRPAVNSVEHATWRRLRLVPFPYRYARPDRMRPGDRPVDTGLRRRLQSGAQRRAMLAWIVAGAVRWHTDGINDPTAVVAATDAWRLAEDVIHRFAADRLEFSPEGHVSLAAMFDEYQRWCDAEGRPAGSQKEFGKRLEDHDLAQQHHVRKRKTMHGWRWEGVEIQAP